MRKETERLYFTSNLCLHKSVSLESVLVIQHLIMKCSAVISRSMCSTKASLKVLNYKRIKKVDFLYFIIRSFRAEAFLYRTNFFIIYHFACFSGSIHVQFCIVFSRILKTLN